MDGYTDWAGSPHDMGLPDDGLVDGAERISVTVKSDRPGTTVDITPRRMRRFPIEPVKPYD